MEATRTKIVLGVTVDMSLMLMRGFPQHLADNGWEVHVVASPGPALEQLSGLSGITTHSIPMRRGPAPLADLRSLVAWVSLLRTIRPDVTSVGTPKAGLVGGLAAMLTRVPRRVYVLRGLRMETVTGVKCAILIAAERLAMLSAHRVLSVSPSLRDRAVELGLAKAAKLTVLGSGSSNGVDLGEFDRSGFSDAELRDLRGQLGIVDGVPVVGFVGRLTHDKGLDVLVQARKRLEDAGVDYQLLIVGGVDDAGSELTVRALRQSGRPAVETGRVSNPAKYYAIMDFLCLPTLREGFPNVVLEAGAAGRPTITTNATGSVDSVVDGTTGLVVQSGDAEELANAIARLVSDTATRSRMGGAAKDYVRANFSRQVVWERQLAFYTARGPRGALTNRAGPR